MMESIITPSDDFDWVSARAQCTPFKVFERLRVQVKEDVSKRAAMIESGGFDSFFFEEGGDWIMAARKRMNIHVGVTFSRTANGIAVAYPSRELSHEGILTLSNNGRCVIRVDSMELTLWQFRKLALHDLFFVIDKVTP